MIINVMVITDILGILMENNRLDVDNNRFIWISTAYHKYGVYLKAGLNELFRVTNIYCRSIA